jgi:hypothetical protein
MVFLSKSGCVCTLFASSSNEMIRSPLACSRKKKYLCDKVNIFSMIEQVQISLLVTLAGVFTA